MCSNSKKIYIKNFKSNMYEFIYIKTIITFGDYGEEKKSPSWFIIVWRKNWETKILLEKHL